MNFHSNGKLLLTGEYFVLDGAWALALPTKPGQSLQVVKNESGEINWASYDADHSIWFQGSFSLPFGEYRSGTDEAVGQRLTQIFQAIQQQKPHFFQQLKGLQIEAQLDFPRDWGLGTSSTLLSNLAQWAAIDPFLLLQDTFGGSGYDIACATASGPILYQLLDNRSAIQSLSAIYQSFTHQIYFVYLGKKQDSRQGIARYRQKGKNKPELVAQVSDLTQQFIHCQSLPAFENLIQQHEMLVSQALDLPRAKDFYFSDYWGEIKSLGAWGGDFILATSYRGETETKFYFNERGFSVVLPYKTIIL